MPDTELFPQRHNRIAVGVVHGDVPRVFLAENVEVLGRLLALEVVARTPAARVGAKADAIRTALLEERWGDAVLEWMSATDNVVDGYDDEHVWTEARLERSLADFERWVGSEDFREAHLDRPPKDMFRDKNVLEIHEIVTSTEDYGEGAAS